MVKNTIDIDVDAAAAAAEAAGKMDNDALAVAAVDANDGSMILKAEVKAEERVQLDLPSSWIHSRTETVAAFRLLRLLLLSPMMQW